ncbi:type I-F CRISPR-associated endoribonuclease Cas6/Csy4 [Oryzomicrobium sp.]|uniref:type I-F CRISPR-associated endoribonuclease Cas6/Csy4 n=1 Tax=Oryzomicrobium sp. TaxID=1911578 RepID=UPI003413B3DC
MRARCQRQAARLALPDATLRYAAPAASSRASRLGPDATLRSASTGQQFRLFIEHLPDQAGASPGAFSAYGLSPTATLPWF